MILGHKISVVLGAHRRLDTFVSTLQAWAGMQEVDEVLVADCTDGKLDWRPLLSFATFASFTMDMGNRARHALALLTQGDLVIIADDDVLPHDGFVKELFTGYCAVGQKGIVGVIGRTFAGPSYYKNATFYSSKNITAPVATDFVGVVYLCGRDALSYDLRDMDNSINDLHWCLRALPHIPKHVVPALSYTNLPSSSDTQCLFHNPKARQVREEWFAKYGWPRCKAYKVEGTAK